MPYVRKRHTPVYTEEDIVRALLDNRGGATYRQASQRHGVPTTVLHRRYHGDLQAAAPGRTTCLSPAEESQLARSIVLLGEYGMAFSKQDLCACVKYHLEANSRVIPQFKDNMPGYEWLKSFLQRQKDILSPRFCQNICAKRARVSREIVAIFFQKC